MKLSEHRGGGCPERTTYIEPTLDALASEMQRVLGDFDFVVDKDKIRVKLYHVDKDGNESYAVTIDGYGIYGYIDEPLSVLKRPDAVSAWRRDPMRYFAKFVGVEFLGQPEDQVYYFGREGLRTLLGGDITSVKNGTWQGMFLPIRVVRVLTEREFSEAVAQYRKVRRERIRRATYSRRRKSESFAWDIQPGEIAGTGILVDRQRQCLTDDRGNLIVSLPLTSAHDFADWAYNALGDYLD